MYLPQHFLPIFLTLLSLTPSVASADRKAEKILLSNVKTLTLRKDLKTSHRRVSAVPQLKCIGGVCDLYQVEILRCKNQGSDYDAENIQWTCTSSLPAEFKLGATDVICEGFEGPDDPYVLKGSCGVEYRLLLTEKGEERYGRRGGGSDYGDGNSKSEKWVGVVFWCIFVGVILWMLYAIFVRDSGVRLGGGGGRNPWGGGGWGGGPGGDDPPPPYSRYSSSKQYGTAPRAGQEGWRPGFWSGALGGAAAGYMAGNRGQAQRPRDYQPTGTMWGNNDNGEGSSSWGGGGRTRSSGSSSSSFSSTRHESSGFGSTSRSSQYRDQADTRTRFQHGDPRSDLRPLMGDMTTTGIRVAYLGPPSSYTHQAALGAFDKSGTILEPQASIQDIFSAVHSSSVAYGVVPFENSTNGSVVYTLDLLIDREDRFPSITVCGEAYMDVHHCLLGCVGRPSHAHGDPTPSSDGSRTPTTHVPHPNPPRARPLKDLRHIKRIYSHPQAFGQCEAFLSTYLRGIERQEVSSTSKAAEIVAADSSRTTAAISSKLAADIHGLTLLSEGIEDSEDNTTRFLILQKLEEGKLPDGMSHPSDQSYLMGTSLPQRFKSLVAFKIDHKSSGALAKALAVFGNHGLNLTSINSRPSREHPWHYVFLVEFEGKRAEGDEGEVNAALEELDKPTQGWKWLGSWVDKMSKPSARPN